jgi:hypothetical protein
MRSAIESGFSAVADADHVQRVIGTPCRMIEAWALGDTAAVANVAGRPGPDRSPEALWGRETDPRSNHPKCVLKRAFGRDYDARDLTEIAEAARPAALERACPDSFGPFAAGVRRVFPSK